MEKANIQLTVEQYGAVFKFAMSASIILDLMANELMDTYALSEGEYPTNDIQVIIKAYSDALELEGSDIVCNIREQIQNSK